MALNENSPLRDFAANPEAIELLRKYIPNFDPNNAMLKMALNMPLKAMLGFPQAGVSKEDAKKLFAELAEANLG